MAVILCLANSVAFIDRTSLSLLVQPIEQDLRLTDTKMSLLIGLAFIIAYSGGGLFAGALVDRFPRRWVLSVGVALWPIANTQETWLFPASQRNVGDLPFALVSASAMRKLGKARNAGSNSVTPTRIGSAVLRT